MQTLLLTGGTGYIGSHAAVVFLESGHEVIILDNLSNSDVGVIESIEQITGKRPKFYNADIRNISELEKIFSENTIDGVVHFAGLKAVGESVEKPFEYYENNVIGSLNLFEVMDNHDVRDIIFSSSATVYDPSEIPPFTEETLTGNTSNPYGSTKFIIENMLRDLAHSKNFRVMNLRYFNPVGAHTSGLIGENPHDIPNNLLPYIMKVASGELPELQVFGDDYDTTDGTGVRDYIHVMDLVEAHLRAWDFLYDLNNKDAGKTNQGVQGFFESFNLGTGDGSSVLEMIAMTKDVTGNPLPYSIVARRPGDIASAYCNPDKAKNELSWEAGKTVKQAIADSWNFIQRNI